MTPIFYLHTICINHRTPATSPHPTPDPLPRGESDTTLESSPDPSPADDSPDILPQIFSHNLY